MGSSLGNAIIFLKQFGLFDVILPFLLVFTIIFALLEKTRVLGTEKIKGEDIPRKNMNAMAAFVIAMLVVGTNRIVTAINIALPNIVLLIVIAVSFLLLVGTFYKEGEFDFTTKHGTWMSFFMIIIFIGIILIFLNSIIMEDGNSWLGYIIGWAIVSIGGSLGASIIFLIIAIICIIIVTWSKKKD